MFNIAIGKRLLISTVFGFVAGTLCYLGGVYMYKFEFTLLDIIWIFTNRVLIGFVLGISALRIKWVFHGLLIGLIVGIMYALKALMLGASLDFFILLLAVGGIYGLMIEFFTSVVFKKRVGVI